MREFMNRRGGRGVTVTMIVTQLASDQLDVTRSTVKGWLADDIERGVAEHVEPGFTACAGAVIRRPRGPTNQFAALPVHLSARSAVSS
jgi:hypothetical protein